MLNALEQLRLFERPHLKKILQNVGWLTSQKIYRIALGLIISIIVARYLGPSKFGLLSYANSLVGFLGKFVYLGLSGIVIRDVFKYPEQNSIILGTTFFIKFCGSIIAFILIVLMAIYGTENSVEGKILVITGIGLLFRPFETIEYWFHSKTKAKFIVVANCISFTLIFILSMGLVFINASIILFASTTSLNLAIVSGFLVYFYHNQGQQISKWKIKIQKATELLSQSWILIISGLLAMVNLKIDQIMLRWMIGTDEVGIYSVAVTISEAWYFIPSLLVISIYPTLIDLKSKDNSKYLSTLQKTFDMLFILSFVVALILTFASNPLINLVYGKEYARSSNILMIHLWAGIFMFSRALFSKWILIEGKLYFSLLSNLFGAIVNVALNYILIPKYGGIGAAISTLFSYATASYFILFFNRDTYQLAKMISISFLSPFRYTFNAYKVFRK